MPLQFRFLTENDTSDFCNKVSAELAKGWQLYGEPTMAFDPVLGVMRCGQAVTREGGLLAAGKAARAALTAFAPGTTPPIHMPTAEGEALRAAYRGAQVIGEYGAGGSTAFAATETTARVVAVESDKAWVNGLQAWLNAEGNAAERVELRHCNIGPTSDWGQPRDMGKWGQFWHYPYALWQDPSFDPDVVLIDGRFRTACFAACLIHTRKPLTVLFDDYTNRDYYHVVETIAPVAETIGRLARFEIVPGMVTPDQFATVVPWFFSSK